MSLERNPDGTLIAYAWPGGYPVYYVSHDDQGSQSVLCAAHANDLERDNRQEMANPAYEHAYGVTETITDYDVNWEDDSLFCEACSDGRSNQRIPSAYGDAPDNDICTGY